MKKTQLIDSFNREHTNLRISVTDQCNFRCIYCMPEDMEFIEDSKVMTFDEIVRLARIGVDLGINKIRLTGGEPLVRRGIPELIRRLWQIEGLKDISLTTNGIGLAKQAKALYEAGLRRINVSLDTLNEEKFEHLTRRKVLSKVLEGLKEAQRCGFHPIKVNAVAMRGFIEGDILELTQFARENSYELRFIEFMPLDGDDIWGQNLFFPGKAILNKINEAYPLEPASMNGNHEPVTEPFCEQCNRIRLTADGKLRACLFSLTETDLLTPLRAGASDEAIANLMIEAVKGKEAGHKINSADFVKPSRNMSRIGG
ncbi:GTP 3',8-cyclase MoaA [Candidatus Poribacteria bacterium]|nr:GTP 3',8-cyclase MoaA [Candidatus Poribacteria bacterium]